MLRTTKEIQYFMEESSQYIIQDRVDITIPQRNVEDFTAMISSNFLRGVYYHNLKPESTKFHIDLVNSNVYDYLTKSFIKNGGVNKRDRGLSNCVYLDYMGTPGGNFSKDEYPFEDIRLYAELMNKHNLDRSILAITFSLRCKKPISSLKMSIKKFIDHQIIKIFHGKNFTIILENEKTYQRSLGSQKMLTLFYSIDSSTLSMNLDEDENKDEDKNLFSTSVLFDLNEKTAYLRFWGMSPHFKKNWVKIPNDISSIGEDNHKKISNAIGLIKNHQNQTCYGLENRCDIIRCSFIDHIKSSPISVDDLDFLDSFKQGNEEVNLPAVLKSSIDVHNRLGYEFKYLRKHKYSHQEESEVKEARTAENTIRIISKVSNKGDSFYRQVLDNNRNSTKFDSIPSKKRKRQENKNLDKTNMILEPLNPNELGASQQPIGGDFSGGEVNNLLFNMLPLNHSNQGQILEAQSRYLVTTKDGVMLSLEEFLAGKSTRISGVNNITNLLRENYKDFMKLVLKSIPQTPEEIESELYHFYKDILKIEQILDSVPSYETLEQRLAGVLLELETWSQVHDYVRTQVWDQVEDQFNEGQAKVNNWIRLNNQVDDQLGTRTKVRTKVRDKIRKQIEQVERQRWFNNNGHQGGISFEQVEKQLAFNVKNKIRVHVKEQVEDQLGKTLRHFNFASSYRDGNLNGTLKSAVVYSFMIYQLGTLAMRHSEEFKLIKYELTKYIKTIVSEEKIQAILHNINIPEDHASYLVKTQFDLLRLPLLNIGS